MTLQEKLREAAIKLNDVTDLLHAVDHELFDKNAMDYDLDGLMFTALKAAYSARRNVIGMRKIVG